MKLDILVFAAHPDDAELCCAGTILAHVQKGRKVGIVDLTRGEMGTRGTPEIREKEAIKSAGILGLSARENLGLEDMFFFNDKNHQLKLAQKIRQYQPEIVLTNALTDRHPDHPRGSRLAIDACFVAGLSKVKTSLNGQEQSAWRPAAVYSYIQSNYISPDFVVDVSPYWAKKMEAIHSFESQFYAPNSNGSDEPETFVSSPEFMKLIEARGKELGHSIGVAYGEGFNIQRTLGISNLFDLI